MIDPGRFIEVIFCSRLRDTFLRRKVQKLKFLLKIVIMIKL